MNKFLFCYILKWLLFNPLRYLKIQKIEDIL